MAKPPPPSPAPQAGAPTFRIESSPSSILLAVGVVGAVWLLGQLARGVDLDARAERAHARRSEGASAAQAAQTALEVARRIQAADELP